MTPLLDAVVALIPHLPRPAQARVIAAVLAEVAAATQPTTNPELWLVAISPGADFISAIKAVRAATNATLRDAKELVDRVRAGTPQLVRAYPDRAAAEAARRDFQLVAAATTEIRGE